jgi:hypothetical protein
MTRRLVAPPWGVQEMVWRVRPKGDFETLVWGAHGSSVTICYANGIRGSGGHPLRVVPKPAPER